MAMGGGWRGWVRGRKVVGGDIAGFSEALATVGHSLQQKS